MNKTPKISSVMDKIIHGLLYVAILAIIFFLCKEIPTLVFIFGILCLVSYASSEYLSGEKGTPAFFICVLILIAALLFIIWFFVGWYWDDIVYGLKPKVEDASLPRTITMEVGDEVQVIPEFQFSRKASVEDIEYVLDGITLIWWTDDGSDFLSFEEKAATVYVHGDLLEKGTGLEAATIKAITPGRINIICDPDYGVFDADKDNHDDWMIIEVIVVE